jgi:hypothetical protein
VLPIVCIRYVNVKKTHRHTEKGVTQVIGFVNIKERMALTFL